MAGIGLGLRFNLADWRRGLGRAGDMVKRELGGDRNFGPFRKAAARATLGITGMFKGGFAKIGGFIKGGLGPLLAIGAAVGGILAVKNALHSSVEAADAYGDAMVRLRASLNTLGSGVDLSAAEKQVEVLGTKLQRALGFARAETVDTFANFVTRGFDTRQARQLTILAANYARKTGKPLEDVQRKIADAANGNVDAIKELGVQVAATGNKVVDAQNAVLALKAAYGEVGAELTDPTDRLSAAINDLQISLGERLLPLFEPLVNYAADFVNGLLKSEEGRVILDGIAGALKTGLDFIQRMIVGVSNFVEMVKSGGKVLRAYIQQIINETIGSILKGLSETGFGKLLKAGSGIDLGASAKTFLDYGEEGRKEAMASLADFRKAQDQMLQGGTEGGMVGRISSIAAQGRAMREQASSELSQEIAGTRTEGFAGQVAKDAEREKAKKALEARAKSGGWDGDGALVVNMRAQITARGRDNFDTYDMGTEVGE